MTMSTRLTKALEFANYRVTLNGRTHTPDASGSGFSFSAPTVSVGTISGS